jgi:hypothetical protein
MRGQGQSEDSTTTGWGVVLDTVEVQDVRVLSETVFRDMQAEFRSQLALRARQAELTRTKEIAAQEAASAREIEEAKIAAQAATREMRAQAESRAAEIELTEDRRLRGRIRDESGARLSINGRRVTIDDERFVHTVADEPLQSLELVAEKTISENYQGRVNAGHCCSMAAWDEKTFNRILPKVKEAQLSITTNVLTNLIKQGRNDPPPVRRGIPRLADLINAGINVACAIDDMKNMFYPFGNMNPLETANIAAHVGYLTTPELVRAAFDMPSYNAAKIFRIPEYGICEGYPANLVLMPVSSVLDALRFHPTPTLVMREGIILSQSEVRQQFDSSVPV